MVQLVVIESLLAWIFFLLAFILIMINLYLIHKNESQSKSQMSSLVTVYMICWILYIVTLLPHYIYMTSRGDIKVVTNLLERNDSYTIFWTGIWSQVLNLGVPISVLFLTIERLFCIYFPQRYNFLRKTGLTYMCIVAIVVVLVLNFWIYLQELPLPLQSSCVTYACLFQKTGAKGYTFTKIILGFFNFVVGFTLILKLRSYRRAYPTSQDYFRRANIIVCIVTVMEFLMNFVPQLVTFIFFQAFGIVISLYIGSLNVLLSSIEILISSIIYSYTLKGRRRPNDKNSVRIVVSMPDTRNNSTRM
ncbi:serpentine type 7TM GPCR chemoreceptor srbc domain-containing protein [Ditylenchus destructor]|uniref:Serpentine type 7TM GPCR chemoreceptor srbc domain-containing protein n=1 Tax=Ditylenchus destructor TaxID=166010 RepID=A0AAD4MNY0_9BILA|nr:serpentine type 7TM GPCR chemoreceptor srbc domain-containing protein [Ditylenchus destructor]